MVPAQGAWQRGIASGNSRGVTLRAILGRLGADCPGLVLREVGLTTRWRAGAPVFSGVVGKWSGNCFFRRFWIELPSHESRLLSTSPSRPSWPFVICCRIEEISTLGLSLECRSPGQGHFPEFNQGKFRAYFYNSLNGLGTISPASRCFPIPRSQT